MMNEQAQLFQAQQQQPPQQSAQPQQQQQSCVIGAIKIKDGLFIGDEFAAQDLEFIVTNKVSHVINCAGLRIANMWEQIGVMYLTFPWMESDEQVLFDEQDEILNEIVKFIDEAANAGESTLVHSLHGQSRACCVLAAYFMRKYNWSLLKTLEFLNSRRSDLEIRASFFCQLTSLERKLQTTGQGAMISQWMASPSVAAPNNINTFSSQPSGLTIQEQKDEELIRNTYLNSRNGPIAEMFLSEAVQRQLMLKEKKDLITWTDLHHSKPLHIASNVSAFGNQNMPQVGIHRRQSSLPLKPAIKGSHRKQLSVGSADMRGNKGINNVTNPTNNITMNRQFSGKQIEIAGNNNNNNNNTNNNNSSNNHSRTSSAGGQINKNNNSKNDNNYNNGFASKEIQQQQSFYPYQQYQSQSSMQQQQQQQQQNQKRITSPQSRGISSSDKDSMHPFQLQPSYAQSQQQQFNQIAPSYLSPQQSQLSTAGMIPSQPSSSLLSHAQSPSQSLVNSSQLPPYSLQSSQQQQSYQGNSAFSQLQQNQGNNSQSVSTTATLKQLSSPQTNSLKTGVTNNKQTSFLNNQNSNQGKLNNNISSTGISTHSSVINRSSSLRSIENTSNNSTQQQQQQRIANNNTSSGIGQHPHKSNSFSLQQQTSPPDSQSNTLRSNSLPKTIENERSPSAKLAYQLATAKTNTTTLNSTQSSNTAVGSSSLPTNQNATTTSQPIPPYESFQPAVIQYLQSPQQSRNSAEKHRPNQNNYMRNPTPPSASHVVKHPPSDQVNSTFSSYQSSSQTQSKNPAASLVLLNAGRSPNASSSKLTAGYNKHERPPLKPREPNSNGNTLISSNNNNSIVNTTNSSNCNISMNTSLQKPLHGKQHQPSSSSPSPIRQQQQQQQQQVYQQSQSYGISSSAHPLQPLSYLSSSNTMLLSNSANGQHISSSNSNTNNNSFINQTNSSFLNTNNTINSSNLNNNNNNNQTCNSSFASQLNNNNNSSFGNTSFIGGTLQQQPLLTTGSNLNNNNKIANINNVSGFGSNNSSNTINNNNNNNPAEYSSKLLINNNKHVSINSTKPPSAKPLQSKTNGKENVSSLHSTHIPQQQPLQNNYLSKDSSLIQRQQQLPLQQQQQQQTQKNIPAYRSFSPDLSSLQNKLDKQKQTSSVASTIKNRIRSNSPATALSNNISSQAAGSGGILSNQSGMGLMQQFKRAQR